LAPESVRLLEEAVDSSDHSTGCIVYRPLIVEPTRSHFLAAGIKHNSNHTVERPRNDYVAAVSRLSREAHLAILQVHAVDVH